MNLPETDWSREWGGDRFVFRPDRESGKSAAIRKDAANRKTAARDSALPDTALSFDAIVFAPGGPSMDSAEFFFGGGSDPSPSPELRRGDAPAEWGVTSPKRRAAEGEMAWMLVMSFSVSGSFSRLPSREGERRSRLVSLREPECARLSAISGVEARGFRPFVGRSDHE